MTSRPDSAQPDRPDARPAVLVAEDNPFNREILVRILEDRGLDVVSARDGREALDLLQSRDFRIIFMDILMPRMGGMEAIHRVRDAGVKTPIVIVSALSSREDRRRCLEAGGDAFLPKPVDAAEIEALVRRYVVQAGEPDPEAAPEPTTKMDPTFNFSAHRALLVEADPTRAKRLEAALSEIGLRVETVAGGGEAWERFRRRSYRYHFVVSNIFLPDIDGLGLLARLRKDFEEVPFFLVVETPDPDTAALAAELGATGLVAADDLEETLPPLLESAAYRHCGNAACEPSTTTARQVRQAQAQLVRRGCEGGCPGIDLAHLPLSDAGGDLALCRRLEGDSCGVVLGDVAGHNVMASYFGAMFLGMLTSAWPRYPDPGDLIRAMNRKLTGGDYDAHLCAAALRWREREQRVEIAVAGIPGGLRVRPEPDGTLNLRETAGGGLCLGLVDREELFLEETVGLRPGDWLFFFTDGVERGDLAAALSADPSLLRTGTVNGMGRRLLDRLFTHKNQRDDAALVVLHAPSGPAWRHVLASTYEAVDVACAWASDRLAEAGAPPGVDPDAVLLALREALNNAVEHGNRFADDRTVALEIRRDENRLVLQVADEGKGPSAPDPGRDILAVPPAQRRGRGLPALRALADQVLFEGGRVTLIFERKAT
ncbi:MAG: response regulator [Desulfococcaceae bacterium]